LVNKTAYVQTSDQWFSITDQLNLGMRMVELDTHWVDDELRIAHCGGQHSVDVDNFLHAIEEFEALFGNVTWWDMETIGCDPSLSSIPVNEQRSLASAFEEILTWVQQPQNSQEFLVIFFDDQPDLLWWGKVPVLVSLIDEYFGDLVYTPADQHKGGWPILSDLVASGKRIVFNSGSDYGYSMSDNIFFKCGPELCNWTEPDVNWFTQLYPECTYLWNDTTLTRMNQGQILRPETSEIMYGFWSGGDAYLLNETTLPPLVQCNTNMPSPDNLSPDRMAAQIWSWAKGVVPDGSGSMCSAERSSDGRWELVSCTPTKLPAACKKNGQGPLSYIWVLTSPVTHDALSCPSGYTFACPSSGYENQVVRALITTSGATHAWINTP